MFWEKFGLVQKKIFLYEINEAFELLNSIIMDMGKFVPEWDKNKQDKINTILEDINDAIVKKDFLLVADLMEYKLKPAFNESMN